MRWSVLVAITIFCTSVPRAAGSPSPGPPLSPGTTWTYRHTVVRVSGTTDIGTARIVFGGGTLFVRHPD